jgi:hypothetical protein
LGGILLGLVLVTGFTAATMLLWNWLMPAIFGITTISFLQALGLLALSKILFTGFWGGGGYHMYHSRKKNYWHNRFEEKWKHMPRERRHEYMNKMREKGFGPKCDNVEEPKTNEEQD